MKRILTSALAALALTIGATVHAAESAECGTVRFGQVNWTGVSAKTETAAWLLEQMGYETDIITASVPIMFQSLATDDRDAFLGLWLPTQRSMVQDRMSKGEIDIITKNLEGAKYTVGVNQAAWDAGVKHFKDLKNHIDKFDGEILGIEAGNDGNIIIKKMIEDNAYGMGEFELKPSSEAGMLTEVQRRIRRDKWAAWLAWAPHPMNLNIDLQFLNGGEDYWGPNQGGATVYTLSREGYAWQCPNVGQFLENYTFTVEEQSQMAGYVINEGMDYAEAGRKLIQEKPDLLNRWFGGGGTYQTGPIKTRDGKKNALDAVKSAL
ncbi:MAG: glycine betaine ABC transporter substrate-binding protein [Halofilum sp. (in: g-proteobacteria)]|nr:glycine betaine ABC transporter substrate-binding protein [Halofilum sp. (in: g-proteobacteria)]